MCFHDSNCYTVILTHFAWWHSYRWSTRLLFLGSRRQSSHWDKLILSEWQNFLWVKNFLIYFFFLPNCPLSCFICLDICFINFHLNTFHNTMDVTWMINTEETLYFVVWVLNNTISRPLKLNPTCSVTSCLPCKIDEEALWLKHVRQPSTEDAVFRSKIDNTEPWENTLFSHWEKFGDWQIFLNL